MPVSSSRAPTSRWPTEIRNLSDRTSKGDEGAGLYRTRQGITDLADHIKLGVGKEPDETLESIRGNAVGLSQSSMILAEQADRGEGVQ
jgi:hypothetical protein